MNLPPERLAACFFTIAIEIPMQPPGAEEHWLNHFAAKKGRERSSAISGLKQGLNDILGMSQWLPDFKRVKIETALARRGLPSLRQLEAGLKKKHRAILKRGRIKDDEEFYLVREILCNLEFDVTEAERAALEKMSADYESRPSGDG